MLVVPVLTQQDPSAKSCWQILLDRYAARLNHNAFSHLLGKSNAGSFHIHNNVAIEMRNNRNRLARQKAHVLQVAAKVAPHFELFNAVVARFSEFRKYHDMASLPVTSLCQKHVSFGEQTDVSCGELFRQPMNIKKLNIANF